MKKGLYAAVALAAVTLLTVLWLQRDDVPLAERQTWLSQPQEDGPLESSYRLWGLAASADADPVAVGQLRFQEVSKLFNQHHFYDKPPTLETDKLLSLDKPSGELYCGTWEQGCLSRLIEATPASLTNELSRHATLLQRYQDIVAQPTGPSPSRMSIEAPLPPLDYLVLANRLVTFSAIQVAKTKSPVEAITLLQGHQQQLRRHLAESENIVTKAVYLSQIASTIDAMAALSEHYHVATPLIPELSVGERDPGRMFKSEFQAYESMLTKMDQHPEMLRMGGHLPAWIGRLLFKPQMALNVMFLEYARLEEIAKQPTSDVAQALSKNPVNREIGSLKNYTGAQLVEIAYVSNQMERYVLEPHNLNSKIALLNTQSTDPKVLPASPYGSTFGPPVLKGQWRCFDGPSEDEHLYRCLPEIGGGEG